MVDFLRLFKLVFFMRLLVEDMIADLKLRLKETKGIRNKVLLKDALNALRNFKAANDNRI